MSGNPAYLDAWAESYKANPGASGDHALVTSAHPLPWLQDRLWRAEWTGNGVQTRPLHFGPRTPDAATIQTPAGPVDVSWNENGTINAPAQVSVETGTRDRQ
jgi:hypothetical protein